MLVEAGGDPDLVDARSKSALDYAAEGLKVRKRKGEIDEATAGMLMSRFQLVLQTISRSTTGLLTTSPRSQKGSSSGKFRGGSSGKLSAD